MGEGQDARTAGSLSTVVGCSVAVRHHVGTLQFAVSGHIVADVQESPKVPFDVFPLVGLVHVI